MNTIEVNKIIDEAIPNFEIDFDLRLNEKFNSVSELLSFVKKEKNFWVKYKVYAKEREGYEKYFKEIENIVVSIQIDVKNNEGSVNNLNLNISLSNRANLVRPSYYNGKLSFKINCVPSNYIDIDNLVEAYKRFYYDKKQYDKYLELIDRASMLSAYLNSDDIENEVGILYLSHKFRKYNIDVFSSLKQTQTIVNDLQQINTSYSETIEENKKDLETYIDEAKSNFDTTIKEQIELNNYKRESINDLFEDKNEVFKVLEEAYEQKLHLEAPIKFWNDKSKEYAKKSGYWFGASVIVSVFLMIVGTYLVHMIYFNPANSKSEVISLIPKSFVLVAIVSLLVYILRVFIKVATSNNHLSLEYAQKAAFTDFYLSLFKYDKDAISESDKTLIYSTLFGKVDTGLIKGSETNEIEKLLLTMFNK